MQEGFQPQNENSENDRFLHDAEYVVNSMWNKAMNVNDLPLSVDLSYQAWLEDFERRKSDFARVLFKSARESAGEDKLRSSQALKRLMELLNNSDRQVLLKELLTTQEAVDELVRQSEQQVESKQTKPERIKGKVKKSIDRFLRRNGDFDDNLK
ncbi:MAG: hypothetical protein Q7S12_00030 [bacterium]|nr:hypothetical protein [bacterium]